MKAILTIVLQLENVESQAAEAQVLELHSLYGQLVHDFGYKKAAPLMCLCVLV